MTAATSRRQRNVRGQGSRLREDIVSAGLAIIERDAGTEGVTLRAVAREVGIAAPSIYAHFPDGESILRAIVDRVFVELIEYISDAVDNVTQPKRLLRTYCTAYLNYAATWPHRYKLLFDRPYPHDVSPRQKSGVGREAFNILLNAVKEVGNRRQPLVAASAIWAGLHGIATLRIGIPQFPWPSNDALVRALLAHGS